MKTIQKKTGTFFLSVMLICMLLPVRADAGFAIPGVCQVQTDTGVSGTVKTLD